MKLLQLLEAHRNSHTDFQVEHFIVERAGSTHLWGMYRQALRELTGRVKGFVYRIDQLRELEDSSSAQGNLALFQWRDKLREFAAFYNAALGLHEHFQSMSEEEFRASEHDFWQHRFRVMAAIDLRTTGRISRTLWEILPTLPDSIRADLLASFKEPTKLLDWHDQLCIEGTPRAPEPSERLEVEDVLKYIEEVAPYVALVEQEDRVEDEHGQADAPGDLLEDQGHAPRLAGPPRRSECGLSIH